VEKSVKIAINAQLKSNSGAGGVESALIGLIRALGRLQDGDEEYVIIGPSKGADWLKPYLGGNEYLVSGPSTDPPPLGPRLMEQLKSALGPVKPIVKKLWRRVIPPNPPRLWPEVPISDGFYESLGCHVIHFPYQEFVLCSMPSVFNPHDLQHLHYPQFFTPLTLARRETIYPAACHFAHTTVVGSQWVKEDVLRQYRLSPEKVQIIPWAPPTQAYPAPSRDLLSAVKLKYSLEVPFAFYPAATWEHKNHLRLLEALVQLRDHERRTLRLISTGYKHPRFWPLIEQALRKLNLEGQVRFLGIVPTEDLRAIYRLAQFVIVPTLFEAASGPVFEAWLERVPIACSNVTSLPEQVGDAALLFDPFSTSSIANAANRLATDQDLREDLIERGERRLLDFSWERTAKAYRAVYRRAAGRTLSEEDLFLLSWDWMRNPKGEKGKIL
jgi:glycosyltransferase involved in cell wall biosynthesis